MNLLRDTKNLALSPKQTVFSNYHMLKDMDAADECVNLRGFLRQQSWLVSRMFFDVVSPGIASPAPSTVM